LQIEILIVGDYDKSIFYGVMGKYFAEPKYKKEMPYMSNKPTTTWFLVLEKGFLIGFGSVNELKNKIIFESSYVEAEYRNKGVWKKINEARTKYAVSKNKPLEVITKEEYLKKYWIENGFEVYKQNGSYYYLRKGLTNE